VGEKGWGEPTDSENAEKGAAEKRYRSLRMSLGMAIALIYFGRRTLCEHLKQNISADSLRRFGATFFDIDDRNPQLLDSGSIFFALVAHISVSASTGRGSTRCSATVLRKAPPLEAWESLLN